MRQLHANQQERGVDSVLDGKFRVLDQLSESAELRVHAGVHLQTGRDVELHMLPPGLVANGPAAERLVRAARAAGRAAHANVLNVLDSGTDPEGRPFVVYERFDGETLAALIARDGPFETAEAGQIMTQVLLALEALHARGVIHRYLRPDCVLIERRMNAAPRVKVTGFGYAFAASRANAAQAIAPELPRGYSRFLAPEVRRGESSTSAAIDIYAAGVLMRFLLTGELDRARDLEANAARAIEHATADDPDERFLSAETFASAVALLLPAQEQAPALPPEDSLAADLLYMQQRRARESGICDAPTGEGRLELIPVLLMVEAIYARSGAAGWERIVREVPDAELLLPAAGRREAYLAQGVPMDLVSRLLGAADRVYGSGDLRSLAEVGEALVRRGLGLFCKALPALSTPDGVVDCVPVIWSSLSRHGQVVVLQRKPRAVRIAVRAQVEPSLELCAVVAGLLRAQLRAIGADAEVNTVACQALGDAADIFVLSWS